MSVVPEKALNPDPLQPMSNGVDISPHGFASYDSSKDPIYKQRTREAEAGFAKSQSSSEELSTLESSQQPDKFEGQPPPQTMITPIMNGMTPLMIFTALGGAFTKQSGYAMMGALNGMVQGMNKGDEAGRERAWQQYDDMYQKWKDQVVESHRIYEEHKAALGNSIDAGQRAMEFALKMRGDEVAGMDKRADQINKEKQLILQADVARAKIAAQNQQIKGQAQILKAQEDLKKNEGSRVILNAVDRQTSIAIEAFKKLMGQYKNSKYGAIAPKSVKDLVTALGDSPEVQQFDSAMKLLNSYIIQYKAAFGPTARPSVFLEKMYAGGVADFWSQGDAAIQNTLLEEQNFMHEGQQALDKEETRLKEDLKMWAPYLRSDQQQQTVDPDIAAILNPA